MTVEAMGQEDGEETKLKVAVRRKPGTTAYESSPRMAGLRELDLVLRATRPLGTRDSTE